MDCASFGRNLECRGDIWKNRSSILGYALDLNLVIPCLTSITDYSSDERSLERGWLVLRYIDLTDATSEQAKRPIRMGSSRIRKY